MNANWLSLTLLGIVLAAPAMAANKGTDAQADKLAAEFKVPESQVETMRAQGLGWGEIRNALAISQKAGVPVSDVLKLRSEHMGWGRIAQHYGFKLGEAVGKGHEETRMERNEGRREERRDERRERLHERGEELHEGHGAGGPHGRG